MNVKPKKVVIIGAGMGGLTVAAGLKNTGIEVEIYERAQEMRWVGSGLSLMTNAVAALTSVGINLDFDGHAEAFDALHILTRSGRPIRSIDFSAMARKTGHPNLAIHRGSLQRLLLDQAAGCRIELGAACTGYRKDGGQAVATFADGREVRADVLVGADGFNSAVRKVLTGPETPTDYDYIVWRATPTFSHPKVTRGYVAHYWGRGQRFGLADIGGGQVYWWGTKNLPAGQSARWHGGKAGIQALFRGWAEEVQAVIAATPASDISSLPAQDRPFIERWGDGPVTLLGDAAHPMLTSLGQGAAIAIEDGAVLAHCLKTIAEPQAALRAYEDRRRERARAIVEASRDLSRIEQYDKPFQATIRDYSLRFARERVVQARNELALTFPGVE